MNFMNRFSIQLQKNLHHFKLRPHPSSQSRYLTGGGIILVQEVELESLGESKG